MIEKDIEKYLVRQVKQMGGLALKFVSPSMAGVPDRIVMIPKGTIYFAELKRPNGSRENYKPPYTDFLKKSVFTFM